MSDDRRKSAWAWAASVLLALPACWIALATPVAIAAKDEPAAKLPEDGAWVRYQQDWERLDNGLKETRKITVSVVGHVVENDEACRWIELKHLVSEGDEKGTWIFKLLIRENDLMENENPLERVIRAWLQSPDKEITLFEPDETSFLPILLWTSGTPKKPSTADETKNIEYQKGRLKAAHAKVGQIVIPERTRPDYRNSWDYTLWQHTDLPIGFAEARIKYEVRGPDMKDRTQQVTVYLLEDAGTGAKTELPDNN
jgi:hypothetical protein